MCQKSTDDQAVAPIPPAAHISERKTPADQLAAEAAVPAACSSTTSFSHRFLAEASKISTLAWPQGLNGITQFMPRLVMLAAVGHIDDGATYIGAAGIGSMFSNACHLMLIRSSTFGAAPLFSQAFGAGNHARIGYILQRVLLLHVLMALCISLPLTAAAGPLLAAFGQPAAIANNAQTFVWIRLLGMPGIVAFNDVQTFLSAQRCVRLPMAVAALASVLQVALLWALTRWLGFIGAPIAMSAVELLQGAALFAAAPWLLRKHKLRSWPAWRREARQACRGWAEIVAKGLPAAIMITAEWFGWECSLFVASGLCGSSAGSGGGGGGGGGGGSSLGGRQFSGRNDVAAVAAAPGDAQSCPAVEAIPICTTLFVLQFIIAFSPGLAANMIRVGNLLGEGRPSEARFCAGVAWCMQVAIQCVLVSVILTFREQIASLFVDDPQVHAHAVALMPITTVYSFFATLAPGWSQALLFGLGARLRVPAALNVVCFFGVGLPLGAALAYGEGLAERGIWMGLLLAMGLIVVGQYTYLARTTNWEQSARRARERALAKDSPEGAADSAARTAADESDGRGLAAADSAAAAVEM